MKQMEWLIEAIEQHNDRLTLEQILALSFSLDLLELQPDELDNLLLVQEYIGLDMGSNN